MIAWLLALDVGAILVSFHAASALAGTAAGQIALPLLRLTALWMVALAWMGLYTSERRSEVAWSLVQVAKTCLLATAAYGLALALTQEPSSAWWVLAWLAPATTLTVGGARLLTILASRLLLGRGSRRRIAVVAWDEHSRRIAGRLERDPSVEFVGYLGPGGSATRSFDAFYPVLGSLDELGKLIDRHSLARIVSQDCFQSGACLREAVNACEEHGAALDLVPDPQGFIPRHIERRELSGMPVFGLRGDRRTRTERLLVRAFDLVVGGTLLLMVLPLMLLVGLAIKLDSPGPVLYRQRRKGQGGQPFDVLKFRSMEADAEARHEALLLQNECAGGVIFKMRRDPRLTRVGSVIRRGTLDELPQIAQVVSGRLSVIGPRPLALRDLENLDTPEEKRWETRRHLARPGLAGAWQANGRSELSFEDLVDFDLYQLECWSFSSDLILLLKTAGAVVVGRGAY